MLIPPMNTTILHAVLRQRLLSRRHRASWQRQCGNHGRRSRHLCDPGFFAPTKLSHLTSLLCYFLHAPSCCFVPFCTSGRPRAPTYAGVALSGAACANTPISFFPYSFPRSSLSFDPSMCTELSFSSVCVVYVLPYLDSFPF